MSVSIEHQVYFFISRSIFLFNLYLESLSPPPAEHRTHMRLAKKLLVDLTVLCCDIKDGAVRKNFFRKLFGEPPPLSWI